jgi:TPR repeat protein
MSCCSQLICNGCDLANSKREIEAGLEERCAFCREPLTISKEEGNKRRMKRIKKNCPVAIRQMGFKWLDEGDYETAFEYWTKAAELGDADAHYNLSVMYDKELGVEKNEKKNEKKQMYHLEEAAMKGHPAARNNLGVVEGNNGRHERARKHFIIAANLGYHDSLNGLRRLYELGYASKEDYADALRAYQAAVVAAKSKEREEGEEARKARKKGSSH